MIQNFRTYELAKKFYKDCKILRLRQPEKDQFERAVLSVVRFWISRAMPLNLRNPISLLVAFTGSFKILVVDESQSEPFAALPVACTCQIA